MTPEALLKALNAKSSGRLAPSHRPKFIAISNAGQFYDEAPPLKNGGYLVVAPPCASEKEWIDSVCGEGPRPPQIFVPFRATDESPSRAPSEEHHPPSTRTLYPSPLPGDNCYLRIPKGEPSEEIEKKGVGLREIAGRE